MKKIRNKMKSKPLFSKNRNRTERIQKKKIEKKNKIKFLEKKRNSSDG